jgi:hypothetical protein
LQGIEQLAHLNWSLVIVLVLLHACLGLSQFSKDATLASIPGANISGTVTTTCMSWTAVVIMR